MTSNHGESDKQQNAAEREDSATTRKHSQTLPLITEELAATHSAKEPEPTSEPPQHVTTPVMPPNPIRRDTMPETPAEDTAGTTPSPAPGVAADTRAATAAPDETEAKEEKASEGRISATQLIAGAGAAATSSVIGGQLGVAGTVVGAGVASIVTGLAVTIYGRSLDKGKEKIKEVGSKLAPAVKAQMAKGGPGAKGSTAAASGLRSDSAFASAPAAGDNASGAEETPDSRETEETSQTWWQKLRRKRVLYPVTIGVAAFGIGLGAVVMAESFTEADISPGTSQISRSVTGSTDSGEETGTDGGGSDGSADSGSSDPGSQSGTDSNSGTANTGSSTSEGGSTSAGETESEGTTTGPQTDQGSDTSSSTGSDASASTSSDGTDTSDGSSTSSGSGSQSQGGSDASGGGSSSAGGSGGGTSSGGDSGTGGSGGSGTSSAEG